MDVGELDGKEVCVCKDFCTFSSCSEAVVPCSGRISWNTSLEFINFFTLVLLIGFFFLVKLAGHVEMH